MSTVFFAMKKVFIILLMIILFVPFPIPFAAKDGGSKQICALTWSVTDYHRLTDKPDEYEVGIGVKICGFEVYKNTQIEKDSA